HPLSFLFIVIGILKIEHNYHSGSFFTFHKSRQTVSGFAIVLLFDSPAASLLYCHEILKSNMIIIGFFYFLEVQNL
ncbi:hypothetical protein M2T53_28105, partial [Klebsiella pneumoniae]|nr:hypothetical protein [Klebsiella pneumoniae]